MNLVRTIPQVQRPSPRPRSERSVSGPPRRRTPGTGPSTHVVTSRRGSRSPGCSVCAPLFADGIHQPAVGISSRMRSVNPGPAQSTAG